MQHNMSNKNVIKSIKTNKTKKQRYYGQLAQRQGENSVGVFCGWDNSNGLNSQFPIILDKGLHVFFGPCVCCFRHCLSFSLILLVLLLHPLHCPLCSPQCYLEQSVPLFPTLEFTSSRHPYYCLSSPDQIQTRSSFVADGSFAVNALVPFSQLPPIFCSTVLFYYLCLFYLFWKTLASAVHKVYYYSQDGTWI